MKTDKKNTWIGSSKLKTPTLVWDFSLLGADAYGIWVDDVKEPDVMFDLEIYDMHRPVYAERQIHGSSHTVQMELEGCKTYRWSVRPSYHHGDEIRYGKWMRFVAEGESGEGNGSVGRQASVAPAYTQDFASLKISCK